ncbi:MAG: type II secretion system minor pseudopilin GspK [Desulfobulbaceae bacterium]|nr:type II secretion system minor pseudopilin GspK [Desulfobulbaceae bacterium]
MIIGKIKCLDNQNGIALITVILATALVAILAVSMTFGQHLDIRRTANLLEGDRAMVLALGLEEWGRQVLIRDDRKRDHLGEDWALGLMPIATENGIISGSIVDLQGRINLNNLEVGNAQTMTIAQTKVMLEGLFDFCEVDGSFELVQAVIDWLDHDAQGVAEDNEYLLHDPAYLAANRLMASPSELLLVEGVTPDNYACLEDQITALPDPTAININTASAEVIASFSVDISISEAEEIVRDRPDNGYSSRNDFLNHQGVAGSGLPANGLSLASDFFMIRGQAIFGEAEISLYSLVARRVNGEVEILGRSIGTY